MPARSNLDPAEIPALLPHLTLVDRLDDRFRFRLVGTAIVADFGRDPTGTFIGSNVRPPEFAAALIAAYERVRESGGAVFSTGAYRAPTGLTQAISRLLLPLGNDGRTVDMIAVSRIARIDRTAPGQLDWLGAAMGQLDPTVDVASIDDVDALTSAWHAR